MRILALDFADARASGLTLVQVNITSALSPTELESLI